MSDRNYKQRIAHEMQEFLVVCIFVAPFMLSFATYRIFVVGNAGSAFFIYASALVTALVLAKVILIGEIVSLGRRFEDKPLIFSTIYKGLIFAIFALLFHILEIMVRGMVAHKPLSSTMYEIAVTQRG